MTTVDRLLQSKTADVWSVAPDASVYQALEILADKGIGALPVVDGDELVGIFSERDYARGVVLKGRTSKGTPVRDLMTTKVHHVTRESSIDDCMALMTDKRIRHLPVLEGKELVGVVSIGDVVREVISAQEQMIEEMGRYIRGESD